MRTSLWWLLKAETERILERSELMVEIFQKLWITELRPFLIDMIPDFSRISGFTMTFNVTEVLQFWSNGIIVGIQNVLHDPKKSLK